MTAPAELLAALIEERWPAAAVEAERCDLRRPGHVLIAAVRPEPDPAADTDLECAARRRALRQLPAGDPHPRKAIPARGAAS